MTRRTYGSKKEEAVTCSKVSSWQSLENLLSLWPDLSEARRMIGKTTAKNELLLTTQKCVDFIHFSTLSKKSHRIPSQVILVTCTKMSEV
jgi:hypothetical protein